MAVSKKNIIAASFLLLVGLAPVCTQVLAQQPTERVAQSALPTVFFPKTSLGPDDLAVIINDADPLSVEIGEYYQTQRRIPDNNMIHVRFVPGDTSLSQVEFAKIKAIVDAKTPHSVQAFALTWAKPYRVDCMSITTAFAAGFDKKYCAQTCAVTKPNPYFNSNSFAPYKDFKLRPTMSLAALNFQDAKELIDRGVRSDGTYPNGTGYLLDTSDRNRNVRAADYDEVMKYLGSAVKLERVKANFVEQKDDVLFYFSGSAEVARINSNTFVPGAIADHLTSAGGQLTDSFQMSSLRWLEAGATGSYGAVVEPCNFPAKFPHPGIAISKYLEGASLIEAYWKSVAMPGQGIFIGEPLAKPYGGNEVYRDGNSLVIRSHSLPSGRYVVLGALSGVGPYKIVQFGFMSGHGWKELRVAYDPALRYYQVARSHQ